MKIETPICDFAKLYAKNRPARLHVPGHKGVQFLGYEKFDITEIDGADDLFNADGIIAQSESVASRLFGCPTYYSTEGSSLAIRTMVYLACLKAKLCGDKPLFLATKNAHKSFLTAVGLLDAEVEWLNSDNGSFISQNVCAEQLDQHLNSINAKPTAFYITSPDYFGKLAEIKELAEICHKHGVLLLVDCAHGAYLKFLPQSLFPIDLGADMCAQSAHKTLPCITGGAYLHLSNRLPQEILSKAKTGASIFASTSPSYLIMQSLDYCNYIIEKEFKQKLNAFVVEIYALKNRLTNYGYTLCENEPLKITFDLTATDLTGYILADKLKSQNIYVEFYDNDYVVIMLSPYISKKQLKKVEKALTGIKFNLTQKRLPPKPTTKERALTIAQILTVPTKKIKCTDALGRVYAQIDLPCPPAVPILCWGEIIDQNALELFEYYGVEYCTVVK